MSPKWQLTVAPVAILLALPHTAGAAETDPAAGPEQAVKELFVAKCASCHSVGKGDRVGPDLKGVVGRREAGWLTRMIQAPSGLLDTDADARALLGKYNGVRMPDLGLKADQVASLVALLDFCSDTTCDLAPKLTPVTQATPEDVERGRELFLGTAALQNGGPACIACHTVDGAGSVMHGGTLAKPLTHSFATLGDEGMDVALRNPAFPLMNKVFGERPVAAEEAFALRAFLYEANRDALDAAGHSRPLSVPLASVLIAIVALMLLNAAWARRLKGIRKTFLGNREQLS